MGFSFDEMGRLKTDDYLDILELDIEYMSGGKTEKTEPLPEEIQANQDYIDAFFNN